MTTSEQVERLLANVPAELRAIPQWVVWKPQESVNEKTGEITITKPPFRPRDPAREASTKDPTTWGTFEEAVACYRANPTLGGVGFVFTRDCGYVGVDVDDSTRVLEKHRATRQSFEAQLDANLLTYCERSPSGKGKHFILKGRLSGTNGCPKSNIKMELYGWHCFLTFTGDVVNGRSEITDQQQFLDEVRNSFGAGSAEQDAKKLADDGDLRRLDLSDEQVIAEMFRREPGTRAVFEYTVTSADWSASFFRIVAALDRVSGSPEQVQRVALASALVRMAPPKGSEKREHKAQRLFSDVFAKVRATNNRMLECMKVYNQAPDEPAENEKAEGRLSKDATALLNAFPQLTTEHRRLTRPPGRLGEFVLAAEQASRRPFTKFAVPVTIAVLSGLLGRRFKVEGDGLRQDFMLAAPSTVGKTATLLAWKSFYMQARKSLRSHKQGIFQNAPFRDRILEGDMSSIQGLMPELEKTPSLLWVIDEGEGQIRDILEGKYGPYPTLRTHIKKFYDASKHGELYSGPRSKGATDRGQKPIDNLNVSVLFSMPIEEFDVSNRNISDGFMSRYTIVRQDTVAGDRNNNRQPLPEHLVNVLGEMIEAANYLDDAYLTNGVDPEPLLWNISFDDEVKELKDQLDATVKELCDQAILRKLPPHYLALGRLIPTSIRIAALCAAVSGSLKVSKVHFEWSFGYVLQNMASLLSDMDGGVIGSNSENHQLVVKRVMMKPEYKSGIEVGTLRRKLKDTKKFKDAYPTPDKAITELLKTMETEKQIVKTAGPPNGEPGPDPDIYLRNTKSPFWKS